MTLGYSSPAGVLLTSFAVVFLAELGDKTLYTIVVLAARNRAIPVMLGGWAAFILQGLLAVLLGTLLGQLPVIAVRWGSATVFLACGIWLLLKREVSDSKAESKSTSVIEQSSSMKQFLTALGLVFVAEFGDATQIGSAALVARLRSPWLVFIGATLGLWAGTVLAVIVGRTLGKRIPGILLRRVAGVVFCVLALVTALP